MSDFFSRITERALGLTESLGPRTPSRFEPPSGALPDLPSSKTDEETQDALEIPRSDASPAQPYYRETPRATRESETSPQPLPSLPERRLGEPPHARPESAPVTSAAGGRRARHETRPTAAPAAETSTRPRSATSTPLVTDQAASTGADSTPRAEAPATHRWEGPETRRPSENQRLADAAQRKTAPSRGQAHATALESAPKHPAPESCRAPEATVGPSLSPTPAERPPDVLTRDLQRNLANLAANADPKIKVSIGRVEVRAVMEPKAETSKPRRSSPGAGSLNDFLERHRQRRHR
jgi:hypothetical protein